MARFLVVDPEEGTKMPFLRGILTRSLQEAGIEFEDAYFVSNQVRDLLSGKKEVTTAELRRRVGRLLGRRGPRLARLYARSVNAPPRPMIRHADGQVTPFSELTYRRCLEASGAGVDAATGLARRFLEHLSTRHHRPLPSAVLGRCTYNWLRRNLGDLAARRYLVWVDYLRSGRPLIILVGGTAGSGKSTVATELANRLEIVRTQSTDMLREVMRMMIPQRLLPVLHTSSFNAWQVLPVGEQDSLDMASRLDTGYRTQADLLEVPCQAVVDRALAERLSMILEGVHLQPSFYKRLAQDGDAVVIPIMLAVTKPKVLRRRFTGRGRTVPQRRAERYLQSFDAIWQLQSYLLDEADRNDVPIVVNENKDDAMLEIMRIVVDAIGRGFGGTPRTVFSAGMQTTPVP